ncbi:hypothetical protein LDENG_00272290 [Lucifuga dentata]|nr:hypothetical protein LDENG_00272290 [Lucifuga dentata]
MLSFSSGLSSSSEGNGNIHIRSLSPWRWRSMTVKHRIPSTIWEAECSSTFCSSPNPGPSGFSLNSVPVYQNALVLNRQQDGGQCYTASYLSVAVGCTCVLAKSSTS